MVDEFMDATVISQNWTSSAAALGRRPKGHSHMPAVGSFRIGRGSTPIPGTIKSPVFMRIFRRSFL